jgi:cell division septation protein DedD
LYNFTYTGGESFNSVKRRNDILEQRNSMPQHTLPNGLKKGAQLPNRSMRLFLSMSMTLYLAACKKKEPPAVIEEVPAAAAPAETDTSATLAEEPNLKKVGEENKAKAPQHSAAAEAAGFSDRGPFVAQVSVFKGKRQAAALVEKLAGQGFPAYVAVVETRPPNCPAPGTACA